MLVKLLKSKLHHATVTDAKLHYPGSIAIDADLMDAVGLLPYEAVLVADLNNGNRVETYVVGAEAGSGQIVILGAAAKLIKPKDIVIILASATTILKKPRTLSRGSLFSMKITKLKRAYKNSG